MQAQALAAATSPLRTRNGRRRRRRCKRRASSSRVKTTSSRCSRRTCSACARAPDRSRARPTRTTSCPYPAVHSPPHTHTHTLAPGLTLRRREPSPPPRCWSLDFRPSRCRRTELTLRVSVRGRLMGRRLRPAHARRRRLERCGPPKAHMIRSCRHPRRRKLRR